MCFACLLINLSHVRALNIINLKLLRAELLNADEEIKNTFSSLITKAFLVKEYNHQLTMIGQAFQM